LSTTPTPPNPTSTEPKRKGWFRRHKILSTIGALALLFVIIGAASGGGSDTGSGVDTATSSDSSDTFADTSDDTADTIAEEEPVNTDEGTVEIIVKSTGSRSGSVTYVRPDTDSLDMSQDTSASLPWHKTFQTSSELPIGWNMNAQQNGGGRLTCIVKQDGEVIARNSSNGQYSMVTCAP